jgi:hypothetical protein
MKKFLLILFFASGLLVLIPTDSNAVTVVVGGYGHGYYHHRYHRHYYNHIYYHHGYRRVY